MNKNQVFFYLFVLFQVSCASLAPQTTALFKAETSGLTQTQLIENVPFVDQLQGQCGPATLSMVFHWAGKSISAEELALQVYTPKMKGSLQSDLISASRRNGFLAVPIFGFISLLSEVQAGHPVIVFENLGLSWVPQWHYAVVIGYDLSKKEIILHTGHEARSHIKMREFEQSWKLGDYWGLVVLPASQLAVSANELAHLTSAVGLEQFGKITQAKQLYQAILNRWPGSLGSLVGLANIAFNQNDLKGAINHLLLATANHPKSASAWHNLAIAQGSAHLLIDAHKSSLQAIELASEDLKSKYKINLSQWLL